MNIRTNEGEDTGGALTIDGASEAFLSRMTPADKDADVANKADEEAEGAEETSETESHDDGEEAGEDTEAEIEDGAEDEEAPEGKPKAAPDDAEVEITVGAETRKVTVGDLKRLYAQEAEITTKTQEVTAYHTAAKENGAKVSVALERLYSAAEERWKPYAEIDMLVASRTMDPEAFTQLRKDAAEAYKDVQFFKTEIDSFITQTQEQQRTQMVKAAEEAVKVLKKDIPDWSNALYDEIRTFAISKGMTAETVNGIVDPGAIKILNMARLYEKGRQAAADKVKRVVKAPKKVLTNTSQNSTQGDNTPRKTKAMQELRKTGNIDAAANAFLSRWID